VLPFKKDAIKENLLASCPSCEREWAVEHKMGARGEDSREVFAALVKALDAISSVRPKFKFSLEIAPSKAVCGSNEPADR